MATMDTDITATTDTAAPSDEHLTSGPATRIAAGRDELGRFTRGNISRMTHGLRSRQMREGLTAEARAALNERRVNIATDLGGISEIGIVKGELISRFVELTAVAETLGNDLAVHGPLTSRGRRRSALEAYLSVTDRLVRVGALLGLDKVRKPTTVADLMQRMKQAGAPSKAE